MTLKRSILFLVVLWCVLESAPVHAASRWCRAGENPQTDQCDVLGSGSGG